MSIPYRHTQTGTVIIGSMGVLVAFTLVIGLAGTVPKEFVLVPLLTLLFLWLFSSLTVEVDSKMVSIRFGPGLIRRSFLLADITAVRPVRNSWVHGWGIRMLWRGWLYNVSGLDAVEIAMANGRVHRIGTDEPQALAAAIEEAKRGGVRRT